MTENKAPDNFLSLTGAPSLDASDSFLHHAVLSNPLDVPSHWFSYRLFLTTYGQYESISGSEKSGDSDCDV